MHTSNYVSSEKARAIAQKDWPGLNKLQWEFLSYLLFGTYFDRVSRKLLLPAELISKIDGKYSQWKSNNYKSGRFLEEFKKIVPIKYSKWSYVEKKRVRVLLEFPMSEELKAEIHKGFTEGWENPVYFASGLRITDKSKKTEREFARQQALESMAKTVTLAQELLDYLNSLASNSFNSLLKNLPQARLIAKDLKKDSEEQLKALNMLLSNPQPFYHSVEKSTRIYALGENITNLASPVRKAVTHGLWECDLKSAQLAISAKIWNIPEVTEFLASGKSIWKELNEWMGVDAKSTFKNTLYALMFGSGHLLMSRILSELGENTFLGEDPNFERIVRVYSSRMRFTNPHEHLDLLDRITQEFRGKEFLTRFKEHPIIAIMLKHRTKQLKKIKEGGGAFNYFKVWLSTKDFETKSILAQVAQSYELALLEPVIRFAIDNQGKNGFTIVIWQHDGMTLKVENPALENLWFEKLKFEVSRRAYKLGIKTGLEFQKN